MAFELFVGIQIRREGAESLAVAGIGYNSAHRVCYWHVRVCVCTCVYRCKRWWLWLQARCRTHTLMHTP